MLCGPKIIFFTVQYDQLLNRNRAVDSSSLLQTEFENLVRFASFVTLLPFLAI